MTHPALRTVLPLSLVTCTSMLAMDLFLPAVPTLQVGLGTTVTLAQASIAVFLAGLAASQLVWGEAIGWLGPRRCVMVGVGMLVVASAGCALAPDIGWLLAMRFVQGAASGAATVVAPTVVRATLSDADAVRGLAAIQMIESIVPAAGPVLGAALLWLMDWRGLFWVLAAVTLAVLPFVVRVTPRQLPGVDAAVKSGHLHILANRKYLRIALSQSLCMGALLTFVASTPQLMAHALGLGASAFAGLQVMSVLTFMAVISQSGRLHRRLGATCCIQLGATLHVALCAALLVGAWLTPLPYAAFAVFWCGFCGALAIRAPASFSEALSLPTSQMGRGSAMLMLGILAAGAVGTQAVAPFLGQAAAWPLAAAMLGFSAISLALVMPSSTRTFPDAP